MGAIPAGKMRILWWLIGTLWVGGFAALVLGVNYNPWSEVRRLDELVEPGIALASLPLPPDTRFIADKKTCPLVEAYLAARKIPPERFVGFIKVREDAVEDDAPLQVHVGTVEALRGRVRPGYEELFPILREGLPLGELVERLPGQLVVFLDEKRRPPMPLDAFSGEVDVPEYGLVRRRALRLTVRDGRVTAKHLVPFSH
jgi:hypothetical protein